MNDQRGMVTAVLLLALAGTAIPAAAAEPHAPFQVIPRSEVSEFSPCDACHAELEPNPERRLLEMAPHVAEVKHGNADIWCNDCHDLNNKQDFKTLAGQRVDYDHSYLVCAQCHSSVYRDWQHGAHGKRHGRWRGGREILNCTACHDPHTDPGIKPRRPEPPPGVRINLEPQHGAQHRYRHGWDQHAPTPSEDSDVSR